MDNGGDNNNNNRLFLNFNNNNERFSPTDRSYPTTPSTFPQPVFQAQGQAQQGQNPPQQQQQQQHASNGYPSSQGYFMNNPYPPANNQPNNQYQQPAPQAYAQPSYQPRGNTDATNGLVHQFSHQNLGSATRGNPYGARQPSPSQRPRTAGATGQQQSYNGYMPPQAPAIPQQPEFEPAPERNPDKYGPLAHNNQKRCAQLASDFFKDSVKRARDRNLRYEIMF